MDSKIFFTFLAFVAFSATVKAHPACGNDGTGSGYFPDKNNCIKFFHCFEGTVEEYNTCGIKEGQQLLYDPEHTWCDFPDRVDCGDRPICDANDQNCHEQGDDEGNVCKNLADGYHPDPNNCRQYWHCFGGVLEEEITCPTSNGKQQLYEPSKNWCDYPDKVNCGDRPICDENDMNCHDQNQDDHVCAGHPDGVHADPANCIKYYNCYNGNGARKICSKDGDVQLLFSEPIQSCDYPDNVHCGEIPICDENDEHCYHQ